MNDPALARAFLAIPADGAWIESARAFLSRVRPGLPEATWTRPESWHLTLKFLGWVSREGLAEFCAAIARAAQRLPPSPPLATEGAAVLPSHGPARVLAVGFAAGQAAEALSQLVERADDTARALGLPAQRRAFRPHVTFARLRRSWPAGAVERYRREASGWRFPVWPIRSCILYESRLASEGAVHTPIGRWSLPAAEGQRA